MSTRATREDDMPGLPTDAGQPRHLPANGCELVRVGGETIRVGDPFTPPIWRMLVADTARKLIKHRPVDTAELARLADARASLASQGAVMAPTSLLDLMHHDQIVGALWLRGARDAALAAWARDLIAARPAIYAATLELFAPPPVDPDAPRDVESDAWSEALTAHRETISAVVDAYEAMSRGDMTSDEAAAAAVAKIDARYQRARAALARARRITDAHARRAGQAAEAAMRDVEAGVAAERSREAAADAVDDAHTCWFTSAPPPLATTRLRSRTTADAGLAAAGGAQVSAIQASQRTAHSVASATHSAGRSDDHVPQLTAAPRRTYV